MFHFFWLWLLFLSGLASARMDKIHSASYLGEKRLDEYHERYYPLVEQDIYRGKINFQDELFFQNYFENLIFSGEGEYSQFLRSELDVGAACSNEMLSKHLDEIRYSYRLIVMSYLLEAQWHMKALSEQLKLGKTCGFNLKEWAKSCKPKSADMKTFMSNLVKLNPTYKESFPDRYDSYQWLKEFQSKKFQWYSQYRLEHQCRNCTQATLTKNLERSCAENAQLLTLMCSEDDNVYGLSSQREAYFLLSRSNIINNFNADGEAIGCLRRFAEVFSHKEVPYPALKALFPPLHSFLRTRHGERFLQGRVFFLGAGKEFAEKGLKDFYVEEQPLQVAKKEETVVAQVPVPQPQPELKKVEEPAAPVVVETPVKVVKPEIPMVMKSAFLQAAEVRASQNLDRMEVDMLKLQYDYVFTLHMINDLSERLKGFMTQNALREMIVFDKLGTKEGPVPLLFLKFMIDMQEHQGLWNILNTVGSRFYVSNEIDHAFKPAPEYVELVNSEETGRQWQLVILKPY